MPVGRRRRIPKQPGPTAWRLLRLIEAEPGVWTETLKERLGVGWNAFYFNLDALVAHRHARVVKNSENGHIVHVYPYDHPIPRFIPRPLTRTEGRIARVLILEPGVGRERIEAALPDVSTRHVYTSIRSLVDAGLVSRESGTRYVGLRPTRKLIDRLFADSRHAGR